MPKPIIFTTSVPLPPGLSPADLLPILHNHDFITELNPLVAEYHTIDPVPDLIAKHKAFTDPKHPSDHNHVDDDGSRSVWRLVTDKIPYFSSGNKDDTPHYMHGQQPDKKSSSLGTYNVSYTASYIDLHNGVQTICHAPLGILVRSRWTIDQHLSGASYLREDVDLRCSSLVAPFVKRTMQKSHIELVDRLLARAQALVEKKRQQDSSLTNGGGPETKYPPQKDPFAVPTLPV
ncbi:hypothetical protein VHEMI04554 [[Torrubiella] hemipterigena]|uniref:DUF7053 domain-containing protein n=1 Tax=[Torrubiella] hemipterigena TaxID=1531966 RepID=A0A0A1SVP0_9HYPO|nr:hypothetical protein VHEMI04554 [[Torrubiella] hemipterigena]